jgi:glycosyltransferase involved in cell wall biosynthesis
MRGGGGGVRRMLWIATGLGGTVTGVERLAIEAVRSLDAATSVDQTVVVDDGVEWADDLAAIATVTRLPRPKGGVGRRPDLAPGGAGYRPPHVAHSFGAPFPAGLSGRASLSYTVHDWGPFFDREMRRAARAAWIAALLRGIRDTDYVHVLSASTRSEAPAPLRPMLRRRKFIIGLPFNAAPSVPVASGVQRQPNLVASVGTNVPRKRFGLLVDACARLNDCQLVLAGNGTETFTSCHARGLGRVTDAQLGRLYQRASLFALVSEYEGFGLPVLEAWLAGCPLLVTEGVARRLPEPMRGAVRVVPTDISASELALQVARALEDQPLRALPNELPPSPFIDMVIERLAAA